MYITEIRLNSVETVKLNTVLFYQININGLKLLNRNKANHDQSMKKPH